MIENHEEHSVQEFTLDKRDNLSEHSENPARIEDIFEWIDGFPLSKTTKNLARDFSDAVLMSEILKFYYPHLVNVHNYIPANSVNNKKENWITLNRKVLSKIDLRLSSETIDQLSHSQAGVIDKLLTDFRDKQLAVKTKEKKLTKSSFDELDSKSSALKLVNISSNKQSIFIKFYKAFKNFWSTVFGILLTIICFWKWFSRKSKCQSLTIDNTICVRPHEGKGERFQITPKACHLDEEKQAGQIVEDTQLQQSYAQVLQELQVKKDMIKTLCQKLIFLERAVKFKDIKIAALTSQLEHNTPELRESSRASPSILLGNNSKLRRRPQIRTQMKELANN